MPLKEENTKQREEIYKRLLEKQSGFHGRVQGIHID
jgi:hypothetical protein